MPEKNNCSYKVLNYFGGRPTRMKCLASCQADVFMKAYRILPLQHQQFLLPDFFAKYNKNHNVKRNKDCLKSLCDTSSSLYKKLKEEIQTCYDGCKPNCVKMTYEMILEEWDLSVFGSILHVQYNCLLNETLTEKYMYTWEETLGFIGGTVGLMCGMSLLSVIEVVMLLVFLLLAYRAWILRQSVV